MISFKKWLIEAEDSASMFNIPQVAPQAASAAPQQRDMYSSGPQIADAIKEDRLTINQFLDLLKNIFPQPQLQQNIQKASDAWSQVERIFMRPNESFFGWGQPKNKTTAVSLMNRFGPGIMNPTKPPTKINKVHYQLIANLNPKVENIIDKLETMFKIGVNNGEFVHEKKFFDEFVNKIKALQPMVQQVIGWAGPLPQITNPEVLPGYQGPPGGSADGPGQISRSATSSSDWS